MSSPSQNVRWVVLELTSKAGGEDPDKVKASIRHHIRNAEVFVPASVVQRGGQRVYQYLLEGYAFILHQHPLSHYARLEETKYVQAPLYAGERRKDRTLATVPQSQIDKLRSQIKVEVDQGIEVGDTVLIISGPYKNITAIVREEIKEQDSVTVHIQLRSTDRLITLPRAFLRLKMKAPLVTFKPRLDEMWRWVSSAYRLIAWPKTSLVDVVQAQAKHTLLDVWAKRLIRVEKAIAAYNYNLDLGPIREAYTKFSVLDNAVMVQRQVSALENPLPSFEPVRDKHKETSFLSKSHAQIVEIYSDVKRMAEKTPVNLVVDGTQLFIRCSEAPGLGSLTDSKGRPTGGIVGFLRGLGSFRKRFPDSPIYVCWDGSSQRRKAMYSGYKANRASRSSKPSFGVDWLKDFLPSLGVTQAYNPQEEADDVMASLVRGILKDKPNVMITTDRDMLQVVTEFTHQLCPAMGGGKEKIYDEMLVVDEYGVEPDKLVHVRAISGDSSDNIPGVSGFGVKTASKAVRLYGSVGALLKSNLAGLGKGQSARLRANEKQILSNVELLKLVDVAYSVTKPNSNPQKVETKLKELGIKPEPTLKAFFPQQTTL